MTMGETINFYGSLLALTGCILFIVIYTAMPFLTHRERWWNSKVGRMMVTKAIAIAGLMLIPVTFYLLRYDMEWTRSVRGVLSALIGIMMVYQSWLVYRTQRGKDD
jgi:hypothetical protein